MPPVVIENPILNSPFGEPGRHWKFGEEGITNEVVDERGLSSYFEPVPAAKRKGGQLPFETEWTKDRIKESEHINRIREKVSIWRRGGHQGTTRHSSGLGERCEPRSMRLWSTLYPTVSRIFDRPTTGKITVKVINHYGDEVLKVYEV